MSAPYPWQGRPWRKLQNQVQNKSLPHAMLLYGQSGLGKLDFSEALVRSMLCDQPDESGIACGNCQGCRLLAAGSHPDFCYVSTEDESQQIKIDQIRALNEFMELTRQCARYKIGLISKAEALNQNAANSLLKTLEEPPLGTLILLVSSNVGRLPATLRSRCQHVLFTLPKRHESSAWLRTHAPDFDPEPVLSMAHGRPIMALALIQKHNFELRRSMFSDLRNLVFGHVSAVSLAKQWDNYDIQQILDWMMAWLADIVKICFGADTTYLDNPDFYQDLNSFCKRTNLEYLFALHEELLEFKRVSESSLNRLLLLEDILLAWSIRWQKT